MTPNKEAQLSVEGLDEAVHACEYNGGTCRRSGCAGGCQVLDILRSQTAMSDALDAALSRQEPAAPVAWLRCDGIKAMPADEKEAYEQAPDRLSKSIVAEYTIPLYRQPAAQGWQLVPKEPTGRMLEVAKHRFLSATQSLMGFNADRIAYKAMLEVAPVLDTSEAGEGEGGKK